MMIYYMNEWILLGNQNVNCFLGHGQSMIDRKIGPKDIFL